MLSPLGLRPPHAPKNGDAAVPGLACPHRSRTARVTRVTHPAYPAVRRFPMDLGDMLGTSFRFLGRRLGSYVAMALIPTLTMIAVFGVLVGVVAVSARTMGSGAIATLFIVFGLLAMAAVLVVNLKFQAMMVAVAEGQAQGRDVSWADASQRTRGAVARYLPIIGVQLAFGVCGMLILGLLMIVPLLAASTSSDAGFAAAAGSFGLAMLLLLALAVVSVIISVRLSFGLPIAALEADQRQGVVGATWQRTRSGFWRILGYTLVLGLVIGVANSVVSWFASIFTPGPDTTTPDGEFSVLWLVGTAVGIGVSMLVSLVSAPLQTIFTYLLYLDETLKARAQGAQGWGAYPGPHYPGQHYPNQQYPNQQYPGPGFPSQQPPQPPRF